MAQSLIDYFKSEKNRLMTFENVKLPNSTAVILSRNGFMFVENRFVCIFCSKSFARIAPEDDDVVKKHFNLKRNCPLYEAESNHMNIPIDADLFKKDKNFYLQLKSGEKMRQLVMKMQFSTFLTHF